MQTVPVPSVGRRLIADHRELDALFDTLIDDIHSGDSKVCQASWTRFEKAMLDHIDAEDVYLLPSFDQVDSVEAAEIRQEHATLRHLLADMGVRLELHAVKEESVKRLVAALRTHAAREESLLYKFADKLPPEQAQSLSSKLSSHRARR